MISTPDDLVVWVDALVSGTLLDPATQQLRLDSIQSLGPDYPQAEGVYGYGYGIDRTGTYYGHGGQITGYNTAMSRDPDTDTTVIVVATLTLAPDGTPVAPALANTVISALPDASAIASTPEPPGICFPDDRARRHLAHPSEGASQSHHRRRRTGTRRQSASVGARLASRRRAHRSSDL